MGWVTYLLGGIIPCRSHGSRVWLPARRCRAFATTEVRLIRSLLIPRRAQPERLGTTGCWIAWWRARPEVVAACVRRDGHPTGFESCLFSLGVPIRFRPARRHR